MLPFIAGATIYLRRRDADPRVGPSLLSDVLTWVAFVAISAVAIYSLTSSTWQAEGPDLVPHRPLRSARIRARAPRRDDRRSGVDGPRFAPMASVHQFDPLRTMLSDERCTGSTVHADPRNRHDTGDGFRRRA